MVAGTAAHNAPALWIEKQHSNTILVARDVSEWESWWVETMPSTYRIETVLMGEKVEAEAVEKGKVHAPSQADGKVAHKAQLGSQTRV